MFSFQLGESCTSTRCSSFIRSMLPIEQLALVFAPLSFLPFLRENSPQVNQMFPFFTLYFLIQVVDLWGDSFFFYVNSSWELAWLLIISWGRRGGILRWFWGVEEKEENDGWVAVTWWRREESGIRDSKSWGRKSQKDEAMRELGRKGSREEGQEEEGYRRIEVLDGDHLFRSNSLVSNNFVYSVFPSRFLFQPNPEERSSLKMVMPGICGFSHV